MQNKLKKDLTLNEWREIAKKTRAVINAHHELFLTLRGKLSKSLWEKIWFRADKSFGKLRNHLDNILERKFLDSPDDIKNIFYGNDDIKE